MKHLIISKEKRQQLIRRLHNHRFRIMMILILYPNIVCFTPEYSDSLNTVIDFMLGLENILMLLTIVADVQRASVIILILIMVDQFLIK